MERKLVCTGIVAILISIAISGCSLRPQGEQAERDKAYLAGSDFNITIPPLPEKPSAEDYLRHAFLANADLRARYWEWRSAIEEIPQAAKLPRLGIGFETMFNSDNMKLWDRSTLMLTNDPMTPIELPSKPRAAGRAALEAARAAGARFEEAKFTLQGRVLSTYYDYALLAETIRIQEATIALLRATAAQVRANLSTARSTQQDALLAQTELDLAQNELQNLQAQASASSAKLNALVGLDPSKKLPLPETLPEPRPLPVSDGELIRIGSERSKGLEALSHEIAGRDEAIEIAKLAFLPDFSLSGSIQGSIQEAVGGMIMLPLQRSVLVAGVEQAKADLYAASAAREQYKRDLAASFVLNLYVLRNDERQIELFSKIIVPRAEQLVRLVMSDYVVGRARFTDLLASQQILFDARLTLARLRIEREKALAAIETWSAVDVETLNTNMPARGGMGGGRQTAPSTKGRDGKPGMGM